jgi:RpiR family carbohydrate utilization transcriptional regulator
MHTQLPNTMAIRIKAQYDTFKSAERRAADLIIQMPSQVAEMTISQAAAQAGCSEPTFTRLSRKLGYKGFVQMKDALSEIAVSPPSFAGVDAGDTPTEVMRKVFEYSKKTLTDTLDIIDMTQYARALDALRATRRVFFAGVGISASVVQCAAHKMLRMGRDCFWSCDPDAMLINAAQLNKGDVCFLISHSGRTRCIINTAKTARAQGATVVSITSFPGAPIVRQSDICLLSASYAERYGEVTGNSIVQTTIIESLLINLMLNDDHVLSRMTASDTAIEVNKA